MLDFYKIQAPISRIADGEALDDVHIVVFFWETLAAMRSENPPALINDFHMGHFQVEARVFVVNGDGWKKRVSNGVFDPPDTWKIPDAGPDEEDELEAPAGYYETEVIQRTDIVNQMHAGIRQYLKRANAKGWRGDHCGLLGVREAFLENGVEVMPRRRIVQAQALDSGDDAKGIVNRADIQAEINQERFR